jgi:hypothetical protein
MHKFVLLLLPHDFSFFSHSKHCFFIEAIFHLIWVFELEGLEILLALKKIFLAGSIF